MRLALILGLVFLLAGCASQKPEVEQTKDYDITKERFIKRIKTSGLSSLLIKGEPALVFCFGGDRFESENILVEEINSAIDEVAKVLPPTMNKKQTGTYGGEIGISAGEKYITRRIDQFDVRRLTVKEQKACERLEKEFSSTFAVARKTMQ